MLDSPIARLGTHNHIRILYAGEITPGGTCEQRLHAFAALGCSVTAVNLTDAAARQRLRRLPERLRRRLFGPRDISGANTQLREQIRQRSFDLLWIDRGLTVDAETLREVRRRQPHCRIVGYSPDDMYARHNQSRQFRAHLPLYDLYVTTKSFNVRELSAMGSRRVIYSPKAFDPRTHRPLQLTDEQRQAYGGPVGFIGSWEHARGVSLDRLARAGIAVRVWGNGWHKQRQRHANLRIEEKPLLGEDYTFGINAFDINLCFLRQMNRDLHTARSVEIVACGAFMLAERTDEHRLLFEEGREAEFFSSDAELLDKARYYLDHPDERQRIAAAGRVRCLAHGYRNEDRLAVVLETLSHMELPADPERQPVAEASDYQPLGAPSQQPSLP